MIDKEQIINRFLDNVKPLTAQIELTRYCNLNCGFCYLKNCNRYELSYSNVKSLLEELKKMGCMKIIFTGGEPILHSQALNIFMFAKKMGFVCEINTNGLLIDETNVKLMAELFHKINVSVHSFQPEKHDLLVGKDGAWMKVINAIKMLKENEAKVNINTVVTKYLEDINQMKEFVENDLKCKWNPDTRIVPTYNGNKDGMNKYSVEEENLENVLSMLSVYTLEKEGICSGVCSAGRKTCFIDVEGNVYPCLQFKNYEYSIYKKNKPKTYFDVGFASIWQNDEVLNEVRQIKENDFTKCKKCLNYSRCFKCIAENSAQTGEFSLPSKEICERETKYAECTRMIKNSI